MKENLYRGSRIAKVLGNPLIYSIVHFLLKNYKTTPSLLAKVLNRNLKTISTHLRILRLLDLVRYDIKGRVTHYWLKHPLQIKKLLDSINKLVKKIKYY